MPHPEATWKSVETCLSLPPSGDRTEGGGARPTPLDPTRAARVDVAFVAESTYPYQRGGASSIIHEMIGGMPELSVGLIYVTWDRSTHASGFAYELPSNVRWIDHVYLSVKEQSPLPRVGGWRRRRLIRQVLAGIHAALAGDVEHAAAALRRHLVDGRGRAFWRAYASKELLEELVAAFPSEELTTPDLFWLQRELFTLAYATLSRRYPPAAVYHAHIQLSGALAAIAGAAQNGGRSVLTEHSLYIRDSINYVLARCPSYPASPHTEPAEAALAPRARAWNRWFRTLGRVLYAMVDANTYQYSRQLEEAVAFGAVRRKARLISNGLDMQRYRRAVAAQDARATARAAGLRAGAWTWRIAFMGRIVALKGVVELIRAAAFLRDEGLEVAVDLVGPASEEPAYADTCARLVTELGLEARVCFKGTLDLSAALGAYDVVVLPSYTEALPIVVLEAMCASCPVVATDVGSIAQILTEELADGKERQRIGPAGVVVPPRDAAALARAIGELASDPIRHAAMRAAGPRRIAARHRARDVMNAYRRLYAELRRSSTPVVKLLQDDRAPLQGTDRAGSRALAKATP